jgi:hypothetical protein
MSFEDFWCIYPRRIAKLAAKKAWNKALKHSPESHILDGARRYAIERRTEDSQFTKHPSTWLNGGCWMDDPGANGSQREKNSAELADELRHGTGCSGGESDLFGESFASRLGPYRHH